MPRSTGQKLKLLILKDIFEEFSDENNGLTMEQILTHLDHHGIIAERKSIYTDIELLTGIYGMDIELDKSAKPPVYKLMSRDFEVPELKMMVDSIASSKFLSEAKTRVLIGKIKKLCSSYEASSLSRQVTIPNRVKSMNNSVHYNVDAIHQSIADNAQISFKYFDYDLHKDRRYFKKGAAYTVSPWQMLYADDNYYLLAYDSEEKKFKHFRVDRMEKVVEEKVGEYFVDRDGAEEFAKFDMTEYSQYTFNMFGGEIESVTMVFQNRMMGLVMDRFGREVLPFKEDDRHFRITVPVAVSDQFFGWVFGLGKAVRITAPENVVEKMKTALREISARYE